MRLLIEEGADLEFPPHYGGTPLLLAAKWGWDTVVDLILDQGTVGIDGR